MLLWSGLLKLSERYIARKLQRLEIKINLTKIDQNQPKFQISEVIFTINMWFLWHFCNFIASYHSESCKSPDDIKILEKNQWEKTAQSNISIFHHSGPFWSQTEKHLIRKIGQFRFSCAYAQGQCELRPTLPYYVTYFILILVWLFKSWKVWESIQPMCKMPNCYPTYYGISTLQGW